MSLQKLQSIKAPDTNCIVIALGGDNIVAINYDTFYNESPLKTYQDFVSRAPKTEEDYGKAQSIGIYKGGKLVNYSTPFSDKWQDL